MQTPLPSHGAEPGLSGHPLSLLPSEAGSAGPGAVRMSNLIPEEGLCLRYVSHCLPMALPPHCLSVLVEVDQEAYLESSPPFHRQPLFERDAAFPSLSSLHPALEQPQLFLQHPAYILRLGVKKSHFNSSSTVCFLRLELMTGAPLFFGLILSQIALELQPG